MNSTTGITDYNMEAFYKFMTQDKSEKVITLSEWIAEFIDMKKVLTHGMK